MELTIDQEMLRKATEEAVNKAAIEGVKSYGVSSAIKEAIGEALKETAVIQAVKDAVSGIDISGLQEVLCKELSKNIVAASVRMLRRNTAALLVRMEGERYLTDDEMKSRMAKYEKDLSEA